MVSSNSSTTYWSPVNMDHTLVMYEGGCHCGAVRFRVAVDKHEAADCNCSICHKKGFLHLIVPPEHFTLLSGEDVLTTYTFNTGIAKHTFCRICGIHPFFGNILAPDRIPINLMWMSALLTRMQLLNFGSYPLIVLIGSRTCTCCGTKTICELKTVSI